MRAYLPAYDLKQPATLSEALELVESGYKPFAGGTDLMVLFEAGKLPRAPFVNIWNLRELRGLHIDNDYVTLGALTTYSTIRKNEIFVQEFPNLVEAARETGAIAIQNRGTVGGNIANASPAADSPPALLSYDASIELLSLGGRRWVDYADFHTGYKTTLMKPNEIISEIKIKRPKPGTKHIYRKVGTRKAQAITKVGLAATVEMKKDLVTEIRLAFTSVAPVPLRAKQTENALRGKPLDRTTIGAALIILASEIKPIDDIRSTEKYRRAVALNLLERTLLELVP